MNFTKRKNNIFKTVLGSQAQLKATMLITKQNKRKITLTHPLFIKMQVNRARP